MSARNTISQVFLRRTYFSPKTRASQLAPRALTLIEMLIGMAITLVMMAAVVNLFANIGAGVSFRRAGMEMNSQLRVARARLYKDLAGAICEARPKLPSDDHNDGYIEIIEGQYSDKNPSLLIDGTNDGDTSTNPELNFQSSLVPSSNITLSSGNVTDGGSLGDYDDILALTTRSQSDPFIGRGLNENPITNIYTVENVIKSDLAEVIWYAVENPADGSLGEPGMRTVYRRALLIAPWIGPIDPTTLVPNMVDPSDHSEFFRRFDISARYDSINMLWIPNTLSDLVKRENRFGHSVTFPHILVQDAILPNTSPPAYPSAVTTIPLHPFGEPFEVLDPNEPERDPDRKGEDVMINNVLAFDLRVYDPGAPQYVWTGVLLEPTDAGWDEAFEDAVANNITPVGYGAFVDLFWNRTTTVLPTGPSIPSAFFDTIATAKSLLTITSPPATTASVAYDTWSFHYENDGIDQDLGNDNGAGIDQGTNGLDDVVPQDILPSPEARNGTDDIGERETSPPYNVPLRGLQVKIRTYEPDSRQIKEVTVTRNLVPN